MSDKETTPAKESKKPAPKKVTSMDILAFVVTEIKQNEEVTISEVVNSVGASRQRVARVLKSLCASRLLKRGTVKNSKNVTEYCFKMGTHPAFKA